MFTSPKSTIFTPLTLWIQRNQNIAKETDVFEGVTTAMIKDGYPSNVPGALIMEIRQAHTLNWTGFSLRRSGSHPVFIKLDYYSQKPFPNISITLRQNDVNVGIKKFAEQYLITHLEEWPCANMTEKEIYQHYIPPDLQALH